MDNRSNIPGISFINQLPYALHIYDSGGWKDPDNYFGKLTLLGTVAANATGYVQPLQTTTRICGMQRRHRKPAGEVCENR